MDQRPNTGKLVMKLILKAGRASEETEALNLLKQAREGQD